MMVAEVPDSKARAKMVQQLIQSAHVGSLRASIIQVNAICPEVISVLFPTFAQEYSRSAHVGPDKQDRRANKR